MKSTWHTARRLVSPRSCRSPSAALKWEKRNNRTHRHHDARDAHPRAQALADACALPEKAERSVAVAVERAGECGVHVSGRANEEEDHEEEGGEVE